MDDVTKLWIMYGLCMDYAWIMHGLRMEHVWIMYGLCMDYAWVMHGLCVIRRRSVAGSHGEVGLT